MQQLSGARSSMRPLFGQRGAARAVHASAGASSDYRQSPLFRACATLTAFALLIMLALPLARRTLLGVGLATTLVSVPMGPASAEGSNPASASASSGVVIDVEHRRGEVRYSEAEWRQRLTPEQYQVLRREATERRWTSPFNYEKRPGVFNCAGCGAPLFNMSSKYESGTGWPSFFQPLPDAVTEVPDYSIVFMPRTEVRCRRCQGHLGHVFDDGPQPTGLRYCMNGAAMTFEASGEAAAAAEQAAA